MKGLFLLPLLPLLALTAQASPPALAPAEIVAAAPLSEWVAIAPSDLLVMELAADAKGKPRRVVIQLMPPPFSQGWVGNIRKLAAARWWNGTSINRVQDNYVVQWGDANAEDKAKAKKLPDGLLRNNQSDYVITRKEQIFVEPEASGWIFQPTVSLESKQDSFAPIVGFALGWPVAVRQASEDEFKRAKPWEKRVFASGSPYLWPVHCYGMVGVGRGMPPDTGSGAELYTVIGHAPRHLDRNIALVGRVIEGIEHLSSLPRGTGALGFYETAEERVPIVSVRLGDEVARLARFEYLSTESETFARYADARANRRDPFFIVPAGGADICNIPVPVRRKP